MTLSAAPSQAVISLSGGMDSTSLLLHLLARECRVFAVSFDYGQKHRLELQRLQANLAYLAQRGLAVPHTTVHLSEVGQLFHSALLNDDWDVPQGHYEQENMKETVVPNRNAIFLSIAFGYALSLVTRTDQPTHIALGVHSGDHAIYPDCRPEFYQAAFDAFQRGNWNADQVAMYLPYLHGDKYTILQDAEQSIAKLQLDFDTVFRNTCTSYAPDRDGRSHGRTGSDVERILAFHRLGRPDPIDYVQPWDLVLQEALRLADKRSEGA